jgi:hypothetical protein
MRLLLAFLISIAAFGQTPAAPAKPAEPAAKADSQAADPAKAEEQAKPAEAAAAPAKADDKAASPTPSGEQWFTGSFDFGYRWVEDVRGNFPTYRSIVNLGAGPKLIGLDFTITDPKHRWFDRIDARANAWGGDPYNTAHLQVVKRGLYEFTGDYRNIAYFNAMPYFANPVAPLGFDQQSFDMRKRFGTAELQFFPGRHIVPYLVFERNSNYGNGVETWVQDGNNEYPVPILLRDSTNNYRGGVRFEYNRWHVTLEQGGTTYKDDDQASFNGANSGNRTTPLLGSTVVLNTLSQNYAIRGSSFYTRVLGTASPFSWMNLYGQYLRSDVKSDARFFDSANGNFALLSSLLLYSGQYNLGTSAASAPHTIGNAGVEFRPFRRLRVIESFTTNKYSATGEGALTQQIILSPGSSLPALFSALSSPQVVNTNQQEVQGILDVTSKITLRGGWRRVWGDATVRAGTLDPAGPLAFGQLKRDVGLAGATIRPWQKLSLNLDYEGARTASDPFRTSLYNYHQVRARGRYQATNNLYFQANFRLLDNQNPTAGVNYDLHIQDSSLAAYWNPGGGKRINVMAEYDRFTEHSNITYLLLPFYVPTIGVYRDNAHTATSSVDLVLPEIAKGHALKLTAGGTFFISAGSRSTRFYQPLGRLSMPIRRNIQWFTEWRWYGYNEPAFLYEGFRTHTFMTGLRVSR